MSVRAHCSSESQRSHLSAEDMEEWLLRLVLDDLMYLVNPHYPTLQKVNKTEPIGGSVQVWGMPADVNLIVTAEDDDAFQAGVRPIGVRSAEGSMIQASRGSSDDFVLCRRKDGEETTGIFVRECHWLSGKCHQQV